MTRIYLSAPHMAGAELGFVEEAFRTNWLSSVGPNLDAFEARLQAMLGRHAVALASGTAAIHLGLRMLGVGPGDVVVCPTFTFVASVNPVRYLGAEPVFVDSDSDTWNLSPTLLAEAVETLVRRGTRPRAIVAVHLFGQCADMDAISDVAARHDIPVLEDAAEALGATYKGRPAGTLGRVSALSFNGNKIVTTTGGGALLTPHEDEARRIRHWATQARDPGVAYEHSELGYNYRMSNVLAGIGRGQLEVLEARVASRRRIAFRYRDGLASLDGVEMMPQAPYGLHTNWLSCFRIDPARAGCSRDAIIAHLSSLGIEARPVWKPMHLQALYRDSQCFGGGVAESLFAQGICLPSSSFLTDEQVDEVIAAVRAVVEGHA